jgi:hypothetical protein
MQRLRMTALEMAIPEDALWMFLPGTNEPALHVRCEAFQFPQCTAAHLRIRSRGERRATRRARVPRIRRGYRVHEDHARSWDHFVAPAGPAR